MPFQEAIGRLKAFEERTKKAVKEEDGYNSLLFSNVDEKTKKHKCEHCGHVNSSQERTERDRGKNWKPWKKRDELATIAKYTKMRDQMLIYFSDKVKKEFKRANELREFCAEAVKSTEYHGGSEEGG
ncbi:hypothetical protein CTI12_AA523910 [Artemisia annua]|uniref:Uncharacterized protein n=1 Tax=Artemisia annua TaxID=35608 RepID=A0A2U1L5H4_ARTAN|nr:hypothetical protein CTI12_AA523910 [Artemisia annua]